MFNIRILSVGKTKEDWLQRGVQEYEKRLTKEIKFTWLLPKQEKELELLAKEETELIACDPSGVQMTSEEFSIFLHDRLVSQGTKMSFLIGGAEGISHSIRKSSFLISFSKMTFTHQMCRLILIEQIYRAREIAKGSNYHKY